MTKEKERLINSDNRTSDIFIVYVKNMWQSRRVQKKMHRMGFTPNLVHIKIFHNWKGHIIAKIVHSKDEYNGNKCLTFTHDLDDVYTSNEFSKSIISYRNFMNI